MVESTGGPSQIQTYSPVQLEFLLSSFALNDGGSSALSSSGGKSLEKTIEHTALRESGKFGETTVNDEHVKVDFNAYCVPVTVCEEEVTVQAQNHNGVNASVPRLGAVTEALFMDSLSYEGGVIGRVRREIDWLVETASYSNSRPAIAEKFAVG